METKQNGDVPTMQKKSLLALLLVLAMMLSGCALVTVNEAKDYAQPIVDVDGETIDKLTFSNYVYALVNSNETMNLYYTYGYMDYVYQAAADEFVKNLVMKHEAAKRGFDKLTEEEQAALNGNNPHVPPKSRFGNRLTSGVFKLLYGHWLPDTQTGLRAFPRGLLGFMGEVGGNRFEYEMTMLIQCSNRKIPMRPIEIETIYENKNDGTHFDPIRDSMRIYKVILSNVSRYTLVSILSFLIDYLVLSLLMFLVFKGSENARTMILGVWFSFRALVGSSPGSYPGTPCRARRASGRSTGSIYSSWDRWCPPRGCNRRKNQSFSAVPGNDPRFLWSRWRDGYCF